jgi:signal transduction histidine kinase
MDRGTGRHWSVAEAGPLPAASRGSRPVTPTDHADAGTQDAAESPATELETLLAVLAHDIRSPLHTLGLSCELLGSRIDATDDTAARQLDTMQYTIRQIRRLVDDVLTMAALRDPGSMQGPAQCAVRPVLRQAIEDHRALAEANGIGLSLHLPGAECEALIHRQSLLRVLSNLLSNAIRFTSHGRVEVHAETFHRELRVAVRDSGRGIPPEQLKDILHGDPLRRHDEDGSGGMGLYIVRRLVAAYGGGVSAESVEGSGSTFTFILPLAGPAEDPSTGTVNASLDPEHQPCTR